MSNKIVTEVAVGILLREDKSFLLAQRPIGKPYAGYWEFPGGKLEGDETVEEALNRELYEELGIKVIESCEWKESEHDYPHAYVKLFFRKVSAWENEIVAREGQLFSWEKVPVCVTPLLPATIPVIEWLAQN